MPYCLTYDADLSALNSFSFTPTLGQGDSLFQDLDPDTIQSFLDEMTSAAESNTGLLSTPTDPSVFSPSATLTASKSIIAHDAHLPIPLGTPIHPLLASELVPALAPEWAQLFSSQIAPATFMQPVRLLAEAYFRFEATRNWPSSSQGLLALGRPAIIKTYMDTWQTFHRLSITPPQLASLVAEITVYWASIQPSCRKEHPAQNALSLSLATPGTDLKAWGRLSSGGRNGIGLLVVALAWCAQNTFQDCDEWCRIGEDMWWVLEEMTKVALMTPTSLNENGEEKENVAAETLPVGTKRYVLTLSCHTRIN